MNKPEENDRNFAEDLKSLGGLKAPSHLKAKILMAVERKARLKKWKIGGIVLAGAGAVLVMFLQIVSAGPVLKGYKTVVAPFARILYGFVAEPLGAVFSILSALFKMSLYIVTRQAYYLVLTEIFAAAAVIMLALLLKNSGKIKFSKI